MSGRTCTFPGCDREYRSAGLCNAHNVQRSRGRPLTPIRVVIVVCTFEGCDRPHNALGLCKGHYLQQHRGQPLRPLRGAPPPKKVGNCGCPWPEEGRFCDLHRAMFWQQTQLRVTERLRA